MKKILLFILCIYLIETFNAQTSFNDAFSPIRSELTSWDPIRGEWLASSLQAFANQKDIPDRTFPEDFTPYEMFAIVPEIKRKNIQESLNRSASTIG
ncbi:MAG: hypothetical protein ACKO6J_07310, partial [Crocinitomicaceae bacterium]